MARPGSTTVNVRMRDRGSGGNYAVGCTHIVVRAVSIEGEPQFPFVEMTLGLRFVFQVFQIILIRHRNGRPAEVRTT